MHSKASSGFNAVPTGYRFAELPPNFRGQETDFAGEFLGHDPKSAYFWTSTTVCEYVDELCEENMPPPRWDMETRSYIESVGGLFAYSLNFNSTGISFQSSTMQTGYSVRLIKD